MSFKTKINSFIRLCMGDPEKTWVVAEKVALLFNKNAFVGEYNKIWKLDDSFIEDVAFLGSNIRQYERLYVVDQFAKKCSELPGNFAECGTYSGGSAFFLCKRSKEFVYLFDSWLGLSRPSSQDSKYWNEGDLNIELEVAERNLSRFKNVIFLEGWIPSRFSEVRDKRFSFVHIDVDLYEPTKDSIEFFWDRIVPGGVLICDDYGFANCAGAKKAIDDFFFEKSQIVSLPTGQAIIFK